MDCKEGLFFDIVELMVTNHFKDVSINLKDMNGMIHFDLAVISEKLVNNTCTVIRYCRVVLCGQAYFINNFEKEDHGLHSSVGASYAISRGKKSQT